MIRVIIFIGILFSPLLANATNKSLSNDLAVEAIKIAEKDLESAIFLIQQSVVADPKNAKAWAIAGKIYLLSEDLPSASDTIENTTVEEDDLEIPAFLRRQKN